MKPPEFPVKPARVVVAEALYGAPAVSLTLPWAPEATGRPRTAVVNGRARIYQPAKARRTQALLRVYAEEKLGPDWEPLRGPLAVEVYAYLQMPKSIPKKRRLTAVPDKHPDWDNIGKTLDFLDKLVWMDDAQIVDMNIHKRYAADDTIPRWEITVWTL